MENYYLIKTIVLVLLLFRKTDTRTSHDQESCGRPLGSYAVAKIVGGYDIGYYKYPWFVALVRNDQAFCGATLIHPKFAMTAAHCYQPFFKAVHAGHLTLEEIFKPTLGVYNICAKERTQKVFKVEKVHVHQKYVKMDPYYDIALMKFKDEAKGYEPCCLPKRALYTETRPREAYISGLGDLKFKAKESTCTMHEARILIYSDDICRAMLNSQGEDGNKLVHAFCAGYWSGGVDACQGDSGGPLIVSRPSGRFELLGLTSFGFDCAKPKVLGIYTDVSHFLGWLSQKMEDTNTTTTTPSESSNPPSSEPPSIPPYGTDKPETTENPVGSNTVTATEPVLGSTVNWSAYPATPWESSTILIPPYQTMPTRKPPHNHPHPPSSITIIINWKKRLAEERKRKEMLRKKSHKHTNGKHHIESRHLRDKP